MVEIDWREPAEPKRNRNYASVPNALDELRANPGRWGVVGVYKTPQSAAVAGTRWRKLAREHVTRSGDAGTFEFAARPHADGTRGEVFGRYMTIFTAVSADEEASVEA